MREGERDKSFYPWEGGKEPFNLSQAWKPNTAAMVYDGGQGGVEWAYKVVPSESEGDGDPRRKRIPGRNTHTHHKILTDLYSDLSLLPM